MKTILIPTDFSKNAFHAAAYALALFKCEQSKFYFLHAYADEVYGLWKTETNEALAQKKESTRKESDKKLAQLIEELTDVPPNPKHTYEGISSFDSLVDAVNNFANGVNTDLIIMGTKGITNDKKLTFGSHTVQIFKYVSCPVLAIPQEAEFQNPKKILFPTDYMLPYKRRELKLLNSISGAFKSQVHCLYISDFDTLSNRQEDNKRFLTDSLPNSYLHFNRTATKNKAEAIREQIAEQEIDFLVMVNSRHSFLEDLLYRSTVDEIGLTTNIPFMVMQNLPR